MITGDKGRGDGRRDDFFPLLSFPGEVVVRLLGGFLALEADDLAVALVMVVLALRNSFRRLVLDEFVMVKIF